MSANRGRYLVFFQYLGTKYCGVMRTPATQATLGVQNYLEMAAQKLRPVGNVTFSISSRTDTGVHALCNSAHVDIERAPGKAPFSEDVLVKGLNFHLNKEPITVLRAIRVSDDFHARYKAISRTYVYRVLTGCKHRELPIFERDRCWGASVSSLDITRVQEAAELLVGTHDFSAFRSVDKSGQPKSPIKTLQQASVTPSASLLPNPQYSDLQFWDFTFRSKSFLYHQVRRMTGALVAVGRGFLTPQQIKLHLESHKSPVFPGRVVAPACGLFLKEVEYAEIDLKPNKAEVGRHTFDNT